MKKEQVIKILHDNRNRMDEFHVKSLSIFGSVARDEATDFSDVDILVEFSEPVGLFTFCGLKLFLEGILGTKVDLATCDALRKEMREQILKEAVRAA
ncbi:MAG: nucleotidyltransferase family protein [Planctomycetaceae bacterium]|nr:nucleotidyltransferase family protein [Planctomycetaceae bacterium]